MNQLQIKLALEVLKNIQTCIVNGDTYIPGVGDCHNKDENYKSPFNLSVSFGICWHVFAHTPGDMGIDWEFLYPVFEELGYDRCYPVESKVFPDSDVDGWDHYRCENRYDYYFKDNEYCKARCELVDQLVEYFENKLQ